MGPHVNNVTDVFHHTLFVHKYKDIKFSEPNTFNTVAFFLKKEPFDCHHCHKKFFRHLPFMSKYLL